MRFSGNDDNDNDDDGDGSAACRTPTNRNKFHSSSTKTTNTAEPTLRGWQVRERNNMSAGHRERLRTIAVCEEYSTTLYSAAAHCSLLSDIVCVCVVAL